MRSLRLRQWLVLLLRMLAIACLALAFARPALQEGGSLLAGARPTHAVLLLDHSYSTRYAPPTGRVFDRLRHRADELLQLFEDRDRVHLIPFASRPDTVTDTPAAGIWRERLADFVPGADGTDVGRALRRAGDRLQDRPVSESEIYLFTDAARAGWDGVAAARAGLAGRPLYVIGTAESERRNLYVADHRVAGWLAAPGQPLTVSAAVGQAGTSAVPVSVDLFVDGERVQRRQVTVPASGTVAVDFSVAPRRSGRISGFIEVETDALGIDNRRYFTLHVPERIAVVLAGPQLRDTYYARRALLAAAGDDAALEVRSLRLGDLGAADLQTADVLVLCNVASPSPATVSVVHRYAADGGGVLVIPGPTADLARLNRELLAGLVPASLAGVVGSPGGTAHVRLDSLRFEAELFAGLGEDAALFHASFELVPERQLTVLARFDDGRPALIEGRGSRSHTLLWAAPLDLAWSDLPLRGAFVPLLHRLCRYLAQPPSHTTGYLVGERAWRRLPGIDVDARVQLASPSGRRRYLEAETTLGDLRWVIPELDEAGIWRVLGPDETVVDEFAVNVDVAEADLTPLTREEMRRRLGPQEVRFLDDDGPLRDLVLAARYGRELWRELLLLAGLLLLLELWIARAPASPTPTT